MNDPAGRWSSEIDVVIDDVESGALSAKGGLAEIFLLAARRCDEMWLHVRKWKLGELAPASLVPFEGYLETVYIAIRSIEQSNEVSREKYLGPALQSLGFSIDLSQSSIRIFGAVVGAAVENRGTAIKRPLSRVAADAKELDARHRYLATSLEELAREMAKCASLLEIEPRKAAGPRGIASTPAEDEKHHHAPFPKTG